MAGAAMEGPVTPNEPTGPQDAPALAPTGSGPPPEAGEVQERAVIRDHRRQAVPFTPSATPPPTGGTRPFAIMPGSMGIIGGATGGTLTQPDRYNAPTPSLTLVANAIKLQSNSLTSVLVVQPGLRLSIPVEINVEYLSPASPRQVVTQLYAEPTGTRLVRQDLIGDGNPRRQFMNITLTERPTTGAGAQFRMNWQVDLDPLFNIEVGSLRFKLLDDCDLAGKTEVLISAFRPDKAFIKYTPKTSPRKGQMLTLSDFAWSGRAVSAKSGLIKPDAQFSEVDCVDPLGCIIGTDLGRHPGPTAFPQLPALIPGQTGVVSAIKNSVSGGTCRAEISYPIVYALFVDPALPPPSAQPIIIDDNAPAPAVTKVGTWCDSGATVGVYGPDSKWSCNGNTGTRFRWTPTIPTDGQYDVYVRWPNWPNRSTTVPYTVRHAGGGTVRMFNQRTEGNDWRLHGRYGMKAGTGNYVEVSSANGQTGADAVLFVLVP